MHMYTYKCFPTVWLKYSKPCHPSIHLSTQLSVFIHSLNIYYSQSMHQDLCWKLKYNCKYNILLILELLEFVSVKAACTVITTQHSRAKMNAYTESRWYLCRVVGCHVGEGHEGITCWGTTWTEHGEQTTRYVVCLRYRWHSITDDASWDWGRGWACKAVKYRSKA